jgi:uncharacterized protein YfdQ (DUF2303 family)
MTQSTSPTDIPRPAFDVTLEAARLSNPVVNGEDGRQHVFVPNGMALRDITDPHRLSPRAAAAVSLDEKRSLVEYLSRFVLKGSVLIADFDTLSITAIIDYHEESADMAAGSVGSVSHMAKFALRPSEEFARWDGFEGELHSQAEFAAFLEENAVDVVEPNSATLIEISRDLEAVQDVNFKSSTRLGSGDRSFTYENETKTKNDVVVPTKFMLNIPLYQGESPVKLTAALRFRVTATGLVLGFEWRRVQYQRLAYFRQIATDIVEATGVPVFFGRQSGK